MSCCPPTSEPARPPAPFTGSLKRIGTNVYTAGPATSKVGVLAFPDIFGLDSGRSKADADALGALGYHVVLIDLVDGDYLDPDNYGNVLVEWFKKYPYETSLKPKIDDAVRYLKSEVKVEKIVSYGYCWGSWVGAAYTTHTDPLFHKGHVSFHPTWIVENILKGDNAVDQLAQSVKVPQVLLAAGDDPPFVKPDGSVHKILKARTDIGEKSDFYLFEDQNHGWVHRGDLSNAATAIAVKKSWQEIAIPFFKNVAPLN